MIKNLLLLILFLPLYVSAQHALSIEPPTEKWADQNGEALFPGAFLELQGAQEKQAEQAQHYITGLLKDFFPGNTSLRIDDFKTSPLGTHISYTQAFLGVPIYGTNVKINIAKNGRVSSVLYKLAQTQNWPKQPFTAEPNNHQILNALGNYTLAKAEKTWYFDGENPQQAYLADYGHADGTLHNEVVISLNNKILHQVDKHRYGGEKDTMASANVFFPDPLTTARKPYGAPYLDKEDSAVFVLDYERIPLQMMVRYRNDSFFLKNQYAQIVELSAPATLPTYSRNGFFNYSRSHKSFEDVNVFANIYHFRQHIKAIGFDTLGKISLKIDAHALNGSDQSEFDFFQNDLKLLFGDGGIDDAEDADVIVHEYSHFLSYSASGDNAYGSERLAIEEGMADYFACSYSKNISPYNWQKVYNWDGNETWNGRSCVTTKNYKNDLSGNRYRDGEIWAGTLMEVQDEIGRDKTDALMLGALYMISKYITMPNAAKLLIQADSMLYQGSNFYAVGEPFVNNGLLPETYLSVKDEHPKNPIAAKIHAAYFSSHNLLYVEFDKPQTGFIKLMDLQGKEIVTQTFSSTNKVNIYAPPLSSGMYILNISANGISQSVKLVK